jgi:subtilisin family serine protease
MFRSHLQNAVTVRSAVTVVWLLTVLLSPLSPAIAQGRPAYVPDEALVVYKPGIQIAQAHRAAGNLRAQVMETYPQLRLQHLRLPKGIGVERAIQALRADPAVAYAEPNYIVTLQADPNDPGYPQQWGLHNTGQTGGNTDADVDAPQAWNLSTGSDNAVIAVIDTGVDYTHTDLRANIWTNPGESGLDSQGRNKMTNGVDDDGNGYVDDVRGINAITRTGNPMDDHNHGTHVAGIIGASGNNQVGVVGVNWRVKIIGAKFISASGNGSVADAIRALDYCTTLKQLYLDSGGRRGANILATNNSWGGGNFSQALFDAIKRSGDAGILFIAAAGNSAVNNDITPFYPASYNLPNILAVAATDARDRRAIFSNYGANSVEMGAPGADIQSTITGNRYASYNGTSMATPFVSGAVALLWSYDRTLSASQIRQRLMNTGDPVAALEGRTVTGRRLNLLNALRNYSPPKSSPPPPTTPALSVRVTTDRSSYSFYQYGTITVSVTDGANPVNGATVEITLRTPSGNTYNASKSTSDGRAVFYFYAGYKDGAGTYSLTARASKSGYTSGQGTASFTVR